MKNQIQTLLAILFVIVFFMPIYLPLIYEPTRLHYYPIEIIAWILSLFILGFGFMKLDKNNK